MLPKMLIMKFPLKAFQKDPCHNPPIALVVVNLLLISILMPTENKQNTPLVEECTMIPGNQVNRGKEKEEVLWRVSNQDKMILKEMDKIRGISLDLIYKVKRLYLKEWLI